MQYYYLTAKIPMRKKKKVNPLKKEIRRTRKKKRSKRQPTISSLKRQARYWFQRWIRYRDLGNKCICEGCQNILSDLKGFDAGHYHKAELYSNVLFNEDNVHGQCKGCNGFKDGNIIEYRKGLLEKIGEERLTSLEEKALYNRGPYKWDRQELIDIKEKYKLLVKDIENP